MAECECESGVEVLLPTTRGAANDTRGCDLKKNDKKVMEGTLNIL